MTNRNAWYLFCLTTEKDLTVVTEEMVPNYGRLYLQSFANFNAVLSWITVDEKYSDQSEELMQRVFYHERVLEQLMQNAAVFPVRFGTLFSSLDKFNDEIIKNKVVIESCLAKIDQHNEWSVKIFLDEELALNNFVETRQQKQAELLVGLAPGIKYLKQQQLCHEPRRCFNHTQYFQPIYDFISEEFTSHAIEYKNRLTTTQQLVSNNKIAVMNWAFLIPKTVKQIFLESIINSINTQYEPVGIYATLTGPWD